MLTLDELMKKGSSLLDPDEIVELLGLSSEDLVEAFHEEIAEEYERIVTELGEYESEQGAFGEEYEYYV